MTAVVTDKVQRANLARQLQNNPLFVEIMGALKAQQVDVFLSDRPLEEVREARAIVKGLKMVEDRVASVLTDERLFKRQLERSQHRDAD